MSGEIIVDASSGDSGSGARDKRITRDILEARRFPEIRFTLISKTGSVALSGASDISVTAVGHTTSANANTRWRDLSCI